ncbi:hypothetical protein QYE76_014603 [Lolium multiflorum]|uniref:Uncharacterized protein n=1 Tax=Lolium multiflorum TaxID=4521 RepID=A0AAD8X5Z1_LOLMU|nr:hypothetical protein QYE76_014603 [Lolium multiflorum]
MEPIIPVEPFVQTEFYQLGNGGDMIFERDLFALSEFLGRPPPEIFGGQVPKRIQFSFRENNWADGLACGLQEGLARLCGQNAMDLEGERFAHYARHNSLGVPMNLPSHPQLRHHVDHLDFMLSETRMELDNSREYANHTHIQLAQQAETIKVIAKERRTLRRLNLKKDYTINRLKTKIASLKATIETQAEQLRDLEGEESAEASQASCSCTRLLRAIKAMETTTILGEVEELQNTNPPVFSKTEEPLDADDWLQTMENT